MNQLQVQSVDRKSPKRTRIGRARKDLLKDSGSTHRTRRPQFRNLAPRFPEIRLELLDPATQYGDQLETSSSYAENAF
eukprot:2508833-Pleurochrysis_carterae.AAC.2